VGSHLENYLKYNRKEKTELELFMRSNRTAGGPQKHMEVVSLGVLVSLRLKSEELCMKAIMDHLPPHQIDYIKQIADEYEANFSISLQTAIDSKIISQGAPKNMMVVNNVRRSPQASPQK